jgi:hypothetical protein
MTSLALWLCLLVVGAIAGFFGLAEWRTVVTAAVSSGIFAALSALFGEEA